MLRPALTGPHLLRAALAAAALLACEPAPPGDREVAESIAAAIVAACPPAAPDDEQARALCAARLTASTVLRDSMREPFMWGSQRPGKGYRLADSDTTRFNALVWRRMYLSLFMFPGPVQIEQSGDFTVIRLAYRFRNAMDIGAYPYPFWHSDGKWDSWQLSPELILIMERGQLAGALRSAALDRNRPTVPRLWSGQWRWSRAGSEMPYVSLYSFLFSQRNPHVADLDRSYRALESEMRENACFLCHAPDNFAKATELEFFNYPNQALYSRHSIVVHLERNTMPPRNDWGLPRGLADPVARDRLLTLARTFQAAGDAALAWEGELRPPVPVPPPKPEM